MLHVVEDEAFAHAHANLALETARDQTAIDRGIASATVLSKRVLPQCVLPNILACSIRTECIVLTGLQPGGQWHHDIASPTLHLIQALQPGLSRTSALRRAVAA